MSTDPPATTIHPKNGKKGERILCFGCEEILEENHLGEQNFFDLFTKTKFY
jgi:hypothetical protein